MWKNRKEAIKRFILDILFPRFCLKCGAEGSYLCQDCFSLIDINERQYCPFCPLPKVVLTGKTCKTCRKSHCLTGLYSASSYDNRTITTIINQFKYEPYVRELSGLLAYLIISHFSLLNKLPEIEGGILIPVPLHKKKLKQRGFNQAEEIAKKLADISKAPVLTDVLEKTRKTLSQIELKRERRIENLKGVFSCKKSELIKNKKVFLVDDVFTTGATMEECAKTLKTAGASKVWGVVAARG